MPWLLTLSIFIFSLLPLLAQQTVTGLIVDSEQNPLIAAKVQVKATTTGTVTDVDGNFQLSVTSDATTLIISYLGYLAREATITEEPVRTSICIPGKNSPTSPENAFVGQRWFTLKRMGVLIEQIRKYAGNDIWRNEARERIEDHHVYWSIPEAELQHLGPNYPQNDGYE